MPLRYPPILLLLLITLVAALSYSDLDNTWQSECFERPTGGTYAKQTVTIEETTYSNYIDAFTTDDCVSSAVTLVFNGTLILTGNATTIVGATDVNWNVRLRTVTVHNSFTQSYFESFTDCWNLSFPIGEPVNVTNYMCPLLGLLCVSTEYDVLQVFYEQNKRRYLQIGNRTYVLRITTNDCDLRQCSAHDICKEPRPSSFFTQKLYCTTCKQDQESGSSVTSLSLFVLAAVIALYAAGVYS